MLNDELGKMLEDAEAIKRAYPAVTNIWFEFNNISVEELRAVAERHKGIFSHDKLTGRMVAQFSGIWDDITCFCYSVPVTVTEHIVENPKETQNA